MKYHLHRASSFSVKMDRCLLSVSWISKEFEELVVAAVVVMVVVVVVAMMVVVMMVAMVMVMVVVVVVVVEEEEEELIPGVSDIYHISFTTVKPPNNGHLWDEQ